MRKEKKEMIRVQLTLAKGLHDDWDQIAKLCGKPLATFIVDLLRSFGGDMPKVKRALLQYHTEMRDLFLKATASEVDEATFIKTVREERSTPVDAVQVVAQSRSEMFAEIKEAERAHNADLKRIGNKYEAKKLLPPGEDGAEKNNL